MKESKNSVLNRLIVVYILAFLVILGGFCYLEYVTATPERISVKMTGTAEEIEESNVVATVSMAKFWRESAALYGIQYDVTILNNSKYNLCDWMVQIAFPKHTKVTDSWSMEYDMKGKYMVAHGVDYNETILPHDVRTFGFIVTCPTKQELDNVLVEATPLYHLYDFQLFWVLITLAVVLFIAIIITVIVEYRLSFFKTRRLEDRNIIEQSLKTFANFIDAKDTYTRGHSDRVAYFSCQIAKKLKLSDRDIELIYYTALLHDVGKMGVPDAILLKPAKLSDSEFEVIKTHTTNGAEILHDFTAIPGIAEGALYHHERFDGKGYPTGLGGEDIPLFARIICVADSYDAMSSNRSYRSKLDQELILNELRDNAGKQFDPDIIEVMLELLQSDAFYAGIPGRSVLDFSN